MVLIKVSVCLCKYIANISLNLNKNSTFMAMMLSSVEYEVASRHLFCLPGPVMMSLKPGSQVAESYSEVNKAMGGHRGQSRSSMGYIQDQLQTKDGAEDGNHAADDANQTAVFNGDGFSLCSPPRTENEVRARPGSSGGTIPLLLGLKCVFFLLLLPAAAHEVPQAAGGDPTAAGASQPEGRAHQAAGAGD